MSKIDELIRELCPDGVEFSKVGDIASVGTGKSDKKDAVANGEYPFYVRSKIIARINRYEFDEEAIIIPGEGGIGEIFHYVNGKYALHQRAYRISFNSNKLTNKFAYYHFMANFKSFITKKAVSATVTSIRKPMITDFPVPIPPLEVQKEIVSILDKFTQLEAELEAELEARRKQYKYYRNQLLAFSESDEGVEWLTLGDLLDYEQPGKYIVKSTEYDDRHAMPVLTAGQSFILGYTQETEGVYEANRENPVIIFDDFTTSNHWVDFDFKVKSSAMKMLKTKDADNTLFRYIYHFMQTIPYKPQDHARQWISMYSKFRIPVPKKEEQERIVSVLDKFDRLVNDISSGLPAEITARRQQYEYYRTKLLTFQELSA